jgi:hypothetical protein
VGSRGYLNEFAWSRGFERCAQAGERSVRGTRQSQSQSQSRVDTARAIIVKFSELLPRGQAFADNLKCLNYS